MADRHREVCDRPLLERLPEEPARLVWFCDVVRIVSPDEHLAGATGDPDCCLVDVLDNAFRANRHQRVQVCLDQAPSVMGRKLLLGQISADP